MKTPLCVGLLLLLTVPTLLAQTPTGKPRPTPSAATPPARPVPTDAQVETRASALTGNMQKALALNPEQVEKVRQINLISVRGVETARLTYRQNVRKMAAVIDDISQSRMSALKNALTPAQFDKYQRKREEKMGVPNAQGNQGTPVPGLGE
ncbi:MAG: hypothetical protein H7Z21_08515 [Hymenobacter sp.]|nr:hypothetical protein [Hymenobacter sp.]